MINRLLSSSSVPPTRTINHHLLPIKNRGRAMRGGLSALRLCKPFACGLLQPHATLSNPKLLSPLSTCFLPHFHRQKPAPPPPSRPFRAQQRFHVPKARSALCQSSHTHVKLPFFRPPPPPPLKKKLRAQPLSTHQHLFFTPSTTPRHPIPIIPAITNTTFLHAPPCPSAAHPSPPLIAPNHPCHTAPR
jgi:hypothetical protein